MVLLNTIKAAAAMSAILDVNKSSAQPYSPQNLVLADCGIGTNSSNITWSTSRQMNWYKGPVWLSAAEDDPVTPDLAVEMPYGDGQYPWTYKGASAVFPNGDTWSVWIEDGTAEPLRAGKAMGTKDGGTTLACYTYRRPLGASIAANGQGGTHCVSAFVCNNGKDGPRSALPPASTSDDPVPDAPIPSIAVPGASATGAPDLGASSSDTPGPGPAAPDNGTTYQPPFANSSSATLGISVEMSPRPVVWYGTVSHFLSSVRFTSSGICSPAPFENGENSTVTARCQGTVDSPINILPILFDAFKNLGSLSGPGFFAVTPGSSAPFANASSDTTLTLPATFNMTVSDEATGIVMGYMGYEVTTPEHSLGIHCYECNATKFTDNYNSAIAAAFNVLQPVYTQVAIKSRCTFDMVCW
ncbi:hypothetical protein CTRI78_v002120 [Colletotrichum trifolii]|uniref:Uncharacterized protein n=1 Tax=Colletotrichum trifolii TaxID=5466 RepID=A0A4R8RMQ5_COLTR|nr:hypothetical protein CTRI78_v002120 [Colletotrichum trifolii]